jgi:phage recombination protein Bet
MGRGNGYNDGRKQEQEQRALTVVSEPRMPMPVQAKAQGLVTSETQWHALIDAVYPSATSVDGVLLALSYCKARNLDPFKRVVHIVPMWNSALQRNVETVWPGIGEQRTTASRTGQWAGTDDCEFGPTRRQAFTATKSFAGRGDRQPSSTTAKCDEFDFPEWAQITVYKLVSGQRCAFKGPKVRFTEIFSGQKGLRVPNERWQQSPFGMLEKCAEAAALRRAFPEELGDSWTSDEMEGKDYRGVADPAAYATVVDNDAQPTGDAGATAAADSQPQAEQPTRDRTDDDSGWDSGELEDFMSAAREYFASAKSLRAVEAAFRHHERELYPTLPDADRDLFDGYVSAARERLGEKPQPQPETQDKAEPEDAVFHDDQPGDIPPEVDAVDDDLDRQADEEAERARGPAPDAAPAASAADTPPYLRNLRMRLADVDTMVDLNSTESAEKAMIAKQDEPTQALCWAAFDERRKQLRQA